MNGNAPIKKFAVGGVHASIWENEGIDKEGNPRVYNSISLSKNYKDKNGEWKSTGSLRAHDLPKAILALQKAYEFSVLKEPELASTAEL